MKRLSLLLVAACRTVPVPTDAGLTSPPSATPESSASSRTAECDVDGDCNPATCCGPFSASDRCVPRKSHSCDAVVCPQVVPDFACVCRAHACATVRAR